MGKKLAILLLLYLAIAAPVRSHEEGDKGLEELLAHAGSAVDIFWHRISSVTCIESVTQEKIGNRGKIEYRLNSSFDYLMMTGVSKGVPTVQESRVPKGETKSADQPLLITSGFPTLLLIFHPQFRECYSFLHDGQETVDGKILQRIRFEHIPGTRSTSALALSGQTFPLDLQGAAWIEADTGIIHKITAGLMSPPNGINLRVMDTTVEYQPQHFTSASVDYWLPVRAAIDVETAHQHWRNIHRFTEYRRFSVKVDKTASQ